MRLTWLKFRREFASDWLSFQNESTKTGQVVSKDEIAEALGYPPNIYDFRRLEIIVRRLRNKVRSEAGIKLPLDTAHRKGYSFTAEIITIE